MHSTRSRHVRWAVGLTLLGTAWLSAGTQPFMEALRGVQAPADFTRDFVGAHLLLHEGPAALAMLEGDVANHYAQSIGAPRLALYGGPYHGHPPAAMLLVAPLVPLGYRTAALVWLVASLAALAWLAYLLAEILTSPRPSRWWLRASLFGLLVLWPPVLHNLAKGQWSIFLAALLAAGWRAIERGRHDHGGAWIGVAASFKLTPLLFLGYLGLRHRRAALAMAMIFGALTLAGGATGDTGLRFISDVQRNAETWQTWTANTASVNGLVARLFAGGPWARPLWHAPSFAKALTVAIGAALVLLALRASRNADASDRPLYGAWCALAVLLNPLAWSHTLVIALIPLTQLIRHQISPAALFSVALVFSIPRVTLARLAAALAPGEPETALLISIHALAGLVLFVLALRVAAVETSRLAWNADAQLAQPRAAHAQTSP
jgi:Glycosyltransferase family 87